MKDSIIQNIAHKLFLERTDILEYELDEHELSLLLKENSDGYFLRDNKLIFSSYDARDYYVSCHYFSEIDSECIDAENIIVLTAFSIWEKSLRGDRKTAGLLLSLYEEKFDILQLLLTSERNPYDIISLADQFIKYVKNIDIQKLFNFFTAIYKEKNQYIGVYSSLEERLSNSPQKCQEIINKFHCDIQPDTTQLYNIALFSLKKQDYTTAIDTLIDDIEKNNNVLSPQSLWILGRIIERSDNKYRNDKIFDVIINNINSPIYQISNAAVQAAVDTVEKLSKIRLVIRNLLELNNKNVIYSLSMKLYTSRHLTSHTDFPFWINCICDAAVNNDDLSDSIFHILTYLTKDESKHELLIDCIFIMIRNNLASEKNKKIENFLYAIVSHHDLINKLFTLALIDENSKSPIFSSLLSTYLFVHRSVHTLEFSLETINNFTEKDFIFLVRRMLGFISNETQLTSLTLSLLKIKKPKKTTYTLVKEVIINEIAMDYPNYVHDEIKKLRSNTKGKPTKLINLYNEILSEIDSYISSFTALPRIKELESSSMLVRAFQKEKDKVMTRNNDTNTEQSFLFDIATKITLKAGIGSFNYDNYNNKGYSEPSYLHEFSSSYSLPRRYIMDNVGYNISLAQFRSAKKDTA